MYVVHNGIVNSIPFSIVYGTDNINVNVVGNNVDLVFFYFFLLLFRLFDFKMLCLTFENGQMSSIKRISFFV